MFPENHVTGVKMTQVLLLIPKAKLCSYTMVN